jgi:hypothetical protein
MALTKLKLVKDDAPNGSTARTLLLQHNLVANYLRALTVKLDADTGVTDTDYTTTLEATGLRLLSGPGTDTEITA